MFRLTIKGLWAHKLRFALTGLAVVLGVAFMAGHHGAHRHDGQDLRRLFATSNAGIDVVVQQPRDRRRRVRRAPASGCRRRRSTPSGPSTASTAAAGSIQGFAQLVEAPTARSSVTRRPRRAPSAPTGSPSPTLNPFTIVDGRRAPTAADEVVLDRRHRRATTTGPSATRSPCSPRVEPHDVHPRRAPPPTASSTACPASTLVAVDDADGAAAVRRARRTTTTVAVAAADGVDEQPSSPIGVDLDDLGAGTFEVLTGEADTAAKQDQFQEDLSASSTPS